MSPAFEIKSWVKSAPHGQKEFRQAVHIILTAITQSTFLQAEMIMKGGILMAIRYRSPRFTTDIDFSSSLTLKQMDMNKVREEMVTNLANVCQHLNYGLDCRVQRCGINPKGRPEASFPSIELKIGYAYQGTPKHQRLLRNASSSVISIDFSLNEIILAEEALEIGGKSALRAYSLTDLLGEKLRSLLQQPVRNRYRRQDIFDLCKLLEQPFRSGEKSAVLESLMRKSESRGIIPLRKSLRDEEVRRRSEKEYQTLADEVEGPLPDFDTSYERVATFYESLPWPE